MLQREPRHKPSPLQFSTTDFSASSSRGTFLSPSTIASPLSSPVGRSSPSPRQQRFGSLSPRQLLHHINGWPRRPSESRARQQSESAVRQNPRESTRFKTVYFAPIIRDSGVDLDSPTEDPRGHSGAATPTSLAEATGYYEDVYLQDELDYLVSELASRFCVQETAYNQEPSSDRLDSPTLGSSISSGSPGFVNRNPFARPHWATMSSSSIIPSLPSRPPAQPLPNLPPTNAIRKGSNHFNPPFGGRSRNNSAVNHFKPPMPASAKNDRPKITTAATSPHLATLSSHTFEPSNPEPPKKFRPRTSSLIGSPNVSTQGANYSKPSTPDYFNNERPRNSSITSIPEDSTLSIQGGNCSKPPSPDVPNKGRPRNSSISSIPENPNFSTPHRSHIRNKSSVNVNGINIRSSMAPPPLKPNVYQQVSPTARAALVTPQLTLPPLFQNLALTDPNISGQPIRYFSPQYISGTNSLQLGSCTFLKLAYGADVECGIRVEPPTPGTRSQSVILQVVQRVLRPESGKTAWLLCSETDVSDAFTPTVRAELASKVSRPSSREEMRKVRKSKRYTTTSSIYSSLSTNFLVSDSEYEDSDSDVEDAKRESDLWITLANSLSSSSVNLPNTNSSRSPSPRFSNRVPISLPSSSPPSPALTDLLSLLTEIRFLHRHFFVLQHQPQSRTQRPSTQQTWGNMMMSSPPSKSRPMTPNSKNTSSDIKIPYLSSSLQRSLGRRFSGVTTNPETSILQTFVGTAAAQASSWLPTSPSTETFTARLFLPRVQGYAERREEMGVRGVWVGEGKQRQESQGWHANMEERKRPEQGYWICFVVAAGVEEALGNSNFF